MREFLRDIQLRCLFERPGLTQFDLPLGLAATYGGTLGFSTTCLIANFVASLDGVVALPGQAESGHLISQNSSSDRFVMGLLRASADAVVVGAGTFRKAPGHLWLPEGICSEVAPLYAEMRRRLRLPVHPTLVVLTGSGDLDFAHPALRSAIVITTADGASRLRGRLPRECRIVAHAAPPALTEVVQFLRVEGYKRILTEGGPSLFARFLGEGLVDELFLTSSPVLLGRSQSDTRKSLVDGLPVGGAHMELLSVRARKSHLFLRYRTRLRFAAEQA